jgi:hypothetical protein
VDKPIYSTLEAAEICDANKWTLVKWASKNNVSYIGEGRRKTYQWTDADIERFRDREKPGRRWK